MFPCAAFGGAISAYRLAQAGIQTTVLERGCRWPTDPWRKIHATDFFPDGRAFWHRTSAKHLTGLTMNFDKFGGILDVTEYENIDVWRGACVGGGSNAIGLFYPFLKDSSVKMLGVDARTPAHAASSSRDGYVPLLFTWLEIDPATIDAPERAPFVELGLVSCFSFLRGASDAVDLVTAARALG